MLEIKKLSSGYGKKQILHNIDLSIKKGELTAIIGPNGSGKSTLLKTLTGIIPSVTGQIIYDGRDISALSSKERARLISYLPQTNPTSSLTVGETVLLGRFPCLSFPYIYSARDKEIAIESMKKTGVYELSSCPLKELSGGNRQSVFLAMALTQNTEFILLDEPTTYLDIKHIRAFSDILKELKNDGKGIVTVIHDIRLAMETADKIAVINDGELIFCGSPDEMYTCHITEDVFGVAVIKSETENGIIYGYGG